MQQFIELYSNTRDLLQSIESINQQAEKLTIDNFKTLKVIELIKRLVNNSLAETMVLSDFLYQLSIIENGSELKEFLDLIELNDDEEIDFEVPNIDLINGGNDETD